MEGSRMITGFSSTWRECTLRAGPVTVGWGLLPVLPATPASRHGSDPFRAKLLCWATQEGARDRSVERIRVTGPGVGCFCDSLFPLVASALPVWSCVLLEEWVVITLCVWPSIFAFTLSSSSAPLSLSLCHRRS